MSSNEDQHFRLRVPANLKAQIEAAASDSKRSLNAEIVSRLEQSFLLPLPELPEDLASRIRLAPSVMRAEAKAELLKLLEGFFPEELPQMTAEEFFELGMTLFRDEPEEDRAQIYVGLITMCRKLSGNADWLPDAPDPEMPF